MSQDVSSYVNLMDFPPQEKQNHGGHQGHPDSQSPHLDQLRTFGNSPGGDATMSKGKTVLPRRFFPKSWAPHIFRGKIWMMIVLYKRYI